MMTRQDYEAIAAILARTRTWASGPGAVAALNHITSDLADLMAAGNPRFDRQRFEAAAGMDHGPGETQPGPAGTLTCPRHGFQGYSPACAECDREAAQRREHDEAGPEYAAWCAGPGTHTTVTMHDAGFGGQDITLEVPRCPACGSAELDCEPGCPASGSTHQPVRPLPGHPVLEGAGYDCCCGACEAQPGYTPRRAATYHDNCVNLAQSGDLHAVCTSCWNRAAIAAGTLYAGDIRRELIR